jgi:hypothetical protein
MRNYSYLKYNNTLSIENKSGKSIAPGIGNEKEAGSKVNETASFFVAGSSAKTLLYYLNFSGSIV